ncbi:reverse transcriptase [Cucumis melo var. makuwa]|uniref:Reverse transcriptase n=1 Tax=Cucumis melo var. makuwa TaxID=1194695 RepID=A0A5A7V6I7_CUCMM|nr:reverse transcriptase [Cucumis melo var. makuwa]
MSEKEKVFYFVEGLKPWAKTKLYEQRVQDLTSAYTASEQLFDLTSDSQDGMRHQSSLPERNRNSRSSSPKDTGGGKRSGRDRRPYQPNAENTWQRSNNRSSLKRPLSYFIYDESNQAEGEVNQIEGGEKPIGVLKYLSSLQKKSEERNVPTERGLLYVDTWINQKQTKSTMIDSGATHNFITEIEARRLRLRWKKDLERIKIVNSVAPTHRRTSETNDDKVGRMERPYRLCGCKNGRLRCLQADIRQPNGFKMILAMKLDESPAQEEPPSAVILLGALEKLGETVPKDTLTIDHGIELLSEVKASTKNAYRMTPPELVELRKPSKMLLNTGSSRPVQAPLESRLSGRPRRVKYFLKSDIRSRYCRVRRTKVEGIETTCVTELGTYEFPVVSFSLTNVKGGKCCSVQSQINVLSHMVECHHVRLLREEDTQWSGSLECQAAFNGLKQATIKGPSLGVADTIKPPKLLNVTQFGHSAQTNSLIKRSQFEIKGSRHSVLLPLIDGPYVGNNHQVHRVEKKREQMADIARVCLEEASRSMEERVDQKRCPLKFEWMTKLSIQGATTSYDYLSTWNRKKTEKSRKSLLTE